MRRSCSPNSGSHQHGPPLLGRVRTPPRSPTSALLCSPPTPSSPSAAAPVVPRRRPTPVRRTRSLPSHRCPREPIRRRRHFYPGSPPAGAVPRREEGLPGAWAILFARAVVDDPAGCAHPSPILGVVTVAFRLPKALGTRKSTFFRGCLAHGPRVRVPTLRRVRYRPRRKARYRPGGSPVAGRASHPLDDIQGFMGSSHLPIPLDQPCLVALEIQASEQEPPLRHAHHRQRPAGAGGARQLHRPGVGLPRAGHHVAAAVDRRRRADLPAHRARPRGRLHDRVQADRRSRDPGARGHQQALLHVDRLSGCDQPFRRSGLRRGA